MIPKKMQLKDVPNKPEFSGRDVYKHEMGDTQGTQSNLGKMNPYDVVMHSGGYYSVPKKEKTAKKTTKKSE